MTILLDETKLRDAIRNETHFMENDCGTGILFDDLDDCIDQARVETTSVTLASGNLDWLNTWIKRNGSIYNVIERSERSALAHFVGHCLNLTVREVNLYGEIEVIISGSLGVNDLLRVMATKLIHKSEAYVFAALDPERPEVGLLDRSPLVSLTFKKELV